MYKTPTSVIAPIVFYKSTNIKLFKTLYFYITLFFKYQIITYCFVLKIIIILLNFEKISNF